MTKPAFPTPSEHKRALLEELLKNRARQPEYGELSLGQERLWQIQQLDEQSPVFNITIAYHLAGPLDTASLANAFQAVVGRHDSLRTRFEKAPAGPHRVISPEAHVALDSAVWEDGACSWEKAVMRAAELDARLPFDLNKAPLFRLKLLQRSARQHALILTIHHLIADRWSLALMVREVSALYSAATQRTHPQIPDRTRPFSEYARWQRAWWAGSDSKPSLAYWTKHLSCPIHPTVLPHDPGRAGLASEHGSRQTFLLGPELSSQAHASSVQEGTTLYTILLSAFSVFLHRHSGQDDLVVCSPIAGRHHPQSLGVVGYFNNLIPVRLDLAGQPSFRTLVRRVGQTLREAQEHQDVPFQFIAGIRNVAAVPLARCLFSLQNTPSLALDLPDVQVSYEDVSNGSAQADLAFFLEPMGSEIRGIVDYKTEGWSSQTMAELIDRFRATVGRLLDHPELVVTELPRYAGQHASENAGCTSASVSNAESTKSAKEQAGAPADNLQKRIETRLLRIWEEGFGRPVLPTSNFFELGGHSLLAARFFAQMEAEFGKTLPLAMLLHEPTVAGLARLLRLNQHEEFWSALVPIQPHGPKTPLFLIHGGGGNVVSYGRLARYLGPDQPVWGLQAPGLKGTQGPLTTIEEMAEHYLRAIRAQQPRGPYYLGGHSQGALIALEMAQRLHGAGDAVGLLLLLDHPGPAAKVTRKEILMWHLHCISDLPLSQKLKYIMSKASWRVFSDPRMPNWIRARVSRWLYETKAPEQTTTRLRLIDSAWSAIEKYRIQAYPGRITLFRANKGSALAHSDPSGGWRQVALEGVAVYEVPGDHMTLLDEPNLAVFAELLKTCLSSIRTAEDESSDAALCGGSGGGSTRG